ncbi:6173_t:CDS:1, partial [Scutellospora calospora]
DKVDELTIANCWTKTSILPLISNTDIELTQNTYLESIEYEESEICSLVVDLIEDLDSMVTQEIETYRKINNTHISTEETLDDTQIVETVLAEQLEYEQGDLDDSDKELPKISPSKELVWLKNFILFAKQQICYNFFFNNNDIKVFCKYLPLMKRKVTESMNQKSIIDFFKIADQSIVFNDDFFDDDNSFS